MMDKALLKTIQKFLEVGFCFWSCPFRMDATNSFCYVTDNAKLKSRSVLIFISLYIVLFVPYQAIQLCWINKDYEQGCYLLLVWLGALEGEILISCFVFQATQLAELITIFVRFVELFTGKCLSV